MPSALAIFAHPDDIEFVAAGTLLLLRNLGWEIHYMNVANGCCGSTTLSPQETASVRERESRQAAELLGATYYPAICNDLEIDYTQANIRKVCAIIRSARPTILLTHSPSDYMEDHVQTCRIAVTAAFARGAPNYPTDPPSPAWDGDMAIYHAQPHGNRDPLGQFITPEVAVDIDPVIDQKMKMLQQHQSQQAWLQSSQGLSSYCQTMLDLGAELTQRLQLNCRFAEGWRRRVHLGFASSDIDPLREALQPTASLFPVGSRG
ncbi:MAG: PIG-L deacetylase family protein [Planctomycetota bacterium]|jgi:LmbE family N-acetylglucosaminyl deacetylase